MIRRNPTLIPMNDNDVQDIRDIVNKGKVDPEGNEVLAAKMKKLADNPNFTNEDQKMLDSMRMWKEREDHERTVLPGMLPFSPSQ
ncbi:hypothetical protein EV368DRAFT_45028 [Lentinula lateritia]|uniref:Uncharacterized protein n=1 Tax=Lentinula aff. lateritia TaxID=2804960 RepID=A0ACC1U9V1_9AGAR|nr:hypothetical protein F5876DRAFT_34291 [Lentinula aff. lateritia]KAJ3850565.1 hypothetical protein EV368DRAFT_45028 [Lentinula lateritia]